MGERAQADAIARRFAGALQGHAPPRLGRVLGWTGAGLGVALAAGGGVLVGVSKADAARLRSDVPQGPLDLENTSLRQAWPPPVKGLGPLVNGLVADGEGAGGEALRGAAAPPLRPARQTPAT